MTEDGLVEQVVRSQVGMSRAAPGRAELSPGATASAAPTGRGEETETVHAEQIITHNVEQETVTVVKREQSRFVLFGVGMSAVD